MVNIEYYTQNSKYVEDNFIHRIIYFSKVYETYILWKRDMNIRIGTIELSNAEMKLRSLICDFPRKFKCNFCNANEARFSIRKVIDLPQVWCDGCGWLTGLLVSSAISRSTVTFEQKIFSVIAEVTFQFSRKVAN